MMSLYFGVSWYVYSHGVKALDGGVGSTIFTWIFWILAATFIIGQILERGNPDFIARLISQAGSLWLSIFLYSIIFVLFVDVFRVIQYYTNVFPPSLLGGALSAKMLFVYGVSFASIMTIGGAINARNPINNIQNITIDKKGSSRDSLKIVLATDVHLGVILGENHAKKLVAQINAQKPDIVIFGGDLVDHNPVPVVKNNMGDYFDKIDAKLGVFAITGNHEFIGKPDISIDYFTQHGVQYIRDTIFTIDGIIQIAGRDDRDKKRFGTEDRKNINDIIKNTQNLPLLLVDHQPVEYAEVEELGVDLMMSGHTHKGQLWPLSFITSLVYENDFGLIQKGKTWFYTSSGYGTWGPPVRTGNRPELAIFNISLK